MLAESFRIDPKPDRTVIERLVRWFWWVCYAYFPIGANSTRLRRALDLVRNIARGREVELEPMDQLDSIPARFDFRLARCKLLSLLMAAERRNAAANHETANRWGDADELLATKGYEALQNLYSSKQLSPELYRSPANRVLVTADHLETLRQHLRIREENACDLRGFVTSELSWMFYKDEDPEGFIEQRLADLQKLEQELGGEQGFLR